MSSGSPDNFVFSSLVLGGDEVSHGLVLLSLVRSIKVLSFISLNQCF